jgi:hypothetical protein
MEISLQEVAKAKVEMFEEQGFELCGVLMKQHTPSGVKFVTVSRQGIADWHDENYFNIKMRRTNEL